MATILSPGFSYIMPAIPTSRSLVSWINITRKNAEADRTNVAKGNVERYASAVVHDLEKMYQYLDDMTRTHIKHEASTMAKEVLGYTNNILGFLSNLGELHSGVKVVMTALTGVVGQELRHQENYAQIAVVHTTMMETIFHMRYMFEYKSDSATDKKKHLEGAMRALCGRVANTIKDWGNFVDAYHIHWQRTYKYLFAGSHRAKIQEFDSLFKRHMEEMDNIFKSTTQVQLGTIVSNTTAILERLNSIQDTDPIARRARQYIDDHGGVDNIRKEPEFVDGFAELLEERATDSMKSNLDAGFDTLLSRHQPRYAMKHEIAGMHYMNSFSPNLRPHEAPHELIENKEFRRLWKNNCRRCTVECRVFVEALHEHYLRQLHTRRRPTITQDDAWTLQFLSRSMYYSAIGDIIDEDGSGYITVLKLDAFLTTQQQRDLRWTNPQWFAFWACGWYNNNAWYYCKIKAMMQNLELRMPKDPQKHPHQSWPIIECMLKSIQSLVLVADVERISSVAAPQQLRHLEEEFRKSEEQSITKRLDEIGAHLVDSASIAAVVGDARIELHMMPLLYVLTGRLCELAGRLAGQIYIHTEDMCKMEELATSFIAIVATYDSRLHSLCHGWRHEAKNIAAQVDRYADGLFRKYYNSPGAYVKAYDELRQCTFGDGNELPQHLTPLLGKARSAPQDDQPIVPTSTTTTLRDAPDVAPAGKAPYEVQDQWLDAVELLTRRVEALERQLQLLRDQEREEPQPPATQEPKAQSSPGRSASSLE